MTNRIISIFTIVLFVLSGKVIAQQYELGFTGVATGYMGDINPTNPFYFKNLGGGIFAKYNLNSTWGLRASFNYLPLYANDANFKSEEQLTRGLLFNNDIKEFSATAEFNFFSFKPGSQRNRYTPYLLAGVAAINTNPYVYYNNMRVNLREYPLEVDKNDALVKFSQWAVSIPIGTGFKYNINGPWSIGAEVNYRTVLSDKIDAVSQYYRYDTNGLPDAWALIADPSEQLSSKGGTLRGNGKQLDGYMTAGITVTYTLLSTKCYWWQ